MKIYYQNGEHFTASMRKIRSRFPRNQEPSETAVHKLITKFEVVIIDKEYNNHRQVVLLKILLYVKMLKNSQEHQFFDVLSN